MVARMTALPMILLGSAVMIAIASIGTFSFLLPPRRLQQLLNPLIALAGGSLLGGSLFHMLPEGSVALGPRLAGVWVALGFTVFLALELFLHWHHSHRTRVQPNAPQVLREPIGFLILVGDALHNFIGGLGITCTFLIDPPAGVAAWLAAVAHEIPQELGDFGVLVHSGWSRRQALLWNVVTAFTFPLGAFIAWQFQALLPLPPLVLFAAGNFLYIAASDLVPEIKQQKSWRAALSSFAWFSAGLLLLWYLASG
jgi:zinc and cadmium transporter